MMKRSTGFWIFVYLVLVLQMAQAEKIGPTSEFDLDAFRWKNRVLLLFGPTGSDPSFRLQKESLADRPQAVSERDMVILEVLEQGGSRGSNGILSEKTAESLRDRFGVRSGRFQVLLIGKDGGVKFRSEEPVPVQDIFALIDSMPMRRQEMESQKKQSF